MNEKKVTIVMSTYNHEDYVEEAIESVLNQTYKNFVFLVADDASTDSTRDILLKYEDKIDEIHFYEVNSGYSRCYPLILASQTEYIAMMNSDDKWMPEKLEKQVEYLDSHPDVAACFTGATVLDDTGVYQSSLFSTKNQSKEEWFFSFWYSGNHLAHPSVLIRADIYKELWSGISVFRQLPDYYMWLRLVQNHEIHVLEENLITFHFHSSPNGKSENVSNGSITNSVRHLMEGSFIWYELFKNMSDSFFKKTFSCVMINPNASTSEELACEKYFILSVSPMADVQQAATYFFYDLFRDEANMYVISTKYTFAEKQFYQREVETGIGALISGKQ